MTQPIDHIVFDLDGTLIDSAVVCAEILNEMLADRGCQHLLCTANVIPFMSSGGALMVSNLLAGYGRIPEEDLVEFRSRYAAKPTPPESLFEGVRGGLGRLCEQGFTLAICSNKPQPLCEKIVEELELRPFIEVVIGTAQDRSLKPDPQLMHITLSQLGASANQVLLVGDSAQDYALAKASGVDFRLVSYGYAEPGWSADDCATYCRFSDLIESICADHGRSMRNRAN